MIRQQPLLEDGHGNHQLQRPRLMRIADGRLPIPFLATAAYISAFFGLYPIIGQPAAAMVALVAILTGQLYGLSGGLVIGFLAIPLNAALFHFVGVPVTNVLSMGSILVIVVAGVAGRLRDLRAQMKSELESKVQERTGDLALAIDRLEQEASARSQTEQQLRHLIRHDLLTGLPNRRMFEERISQEIARSTRDRRLVAILLLDVRGMKAINDGRTHTTGDEVLQTVAERLRECIRSTDCVARWGDDEFAVVVSGLRRAEDAAIIALKVLAAVRRPIVFGGQAVQRYPIQKYRVMF